ncbi:hypothetical protein FRB90_000111 [Tulasnella sp. 427]|nr:hypothetical protein FRB90_000111 [Tulasnella sp. 427]
MTSKLNALVVDRVLSESTVVILEGAKALLPAKALFPSLWSLEYTLGSVQRYHSIHRVVGGAQLRRLVVTNDEPFDLWKVNDVSQIIHLLNRHPGLETLEARLYAFNLPKSTTIPWPLGLRSLRYSAEWDFGPWSRLVERCTELRSVKIGCDCWAIDRNYEDSPAQYDSHPTVVAKNLRTLDLIDVHNAHRLLPILRKTEMPELTELSFQLPSETMYENLESEVADILLKIARKSPNLRSLTVNTWIPLLEIEGLHQFRNMEFLHISNSSDGIFPWAYRDEDVKVLAQSMPHLKDLRLIGLSNIRPGVTVMTLESLAVHCLDLHTLAIGLDAAKLKGQDEPVTPFTCKLTCITFSPLRLTLDVAEPFALDLCTRMPGVKKLQGWVMSVGECGQGFCWDQGMNVLQDAVSAIRNGIGQY